MWQMLKEVSSQRRTENFHGIQQHKWKFLETWENVALLERWEQARTMGCECEVRRSGIKFGVTYRFASHQYLCGHKQV